MVAIEITKSTGVRSNTCNLIPNHYQYIKRGQGGLAPHSNYKQMYVCVTDVLGEGCRDDILQSLRFADLSKERLMIAGG